MKLRCSKRTLSRMLRVTGCRDDARRATDGLPSAADAPSQRSELAKSANCCREQMQQRAWTEVGIYSITSSANASKFGGILRPIAFATPRLIINK